MFYPFKSVKYVRTVYYTNVIKFVDSKQPVDLISIDLSKAFGKIDYAILTKILIKEGFSTRIILIINNFLSDLSQLVKFNGFKSDVLLVTSGVPQGTILGPILFNIFINGVLKLPLKNKLTAYADDLKLFGIPELSMTEDLFKIITWLIEHGMSINVVSKMCAFWIRTRVCPLRAVIFLQRLQGGKFPPWLEFFPPWKNFL